MANYLKTFVEGEVIKASDTNENNEFLLDQISDSAETLNTRITSVNSNVDSKLETLKGKVDKQIEDLSTDIEGKIGNIKVFPDYSKAKEKAWNTPYEAESNGYIIAYASSSASAVGGSAAILNINDMSINFASSISNDDAVIASITLPVSIGDTYKATGANGARHLYFIPAKGVN